ncbi:MAG: hypothetical protein GC152_07320 [Alphaproteobacteria bacterium]|nr:hypothetical protein [Alphaproteobacteria bacterium]
MTAATRQSAPQAGTRRSSSTRRQAFAGALAFGFGVILFAPASLLSPIASSGDAFRFERIDGTLLRGVVRSASFDGVVLGDIDYSLRPLQLALGRISADVSVDGRAARGVARLTYGFVARDIAIKDLSGRFDLSSIRRYRLLGMPFEGSVEARVPEFSWRVGDGCGIASGALWTDALSPQLRRLTGADAPMNGRLACEGRDLSIVLAGANEHGEATVDIRLDPRRNYSLTANVRPRESDLARTLQLIGFREGEDGLIYDVYGPLKGIGL